MDMPNLAPLSLVLAGGGSLERWEEDVRSSLRGEVGQGREAACCSAPRKDTVWLTELRLQPAAVLQGSLLWRTSRLKAALLHPCAWLIALQGCAGDC